MCEGNSAAVGLELGLRECRECREALLRDDIEGGKCEWGPPPVGDVT